MDNIPGAALALLSFTVGLITLVATGFLWALWKKLASSEREATASIALCSFGLYYGLLPFVSRDDVPVGLGISFGLIVGLFGALFGLQAGSTWREQHQGQLAE